MSNGGNSILQATSSSFDLYDVFSMLFPGAALILGLLPFVPQETPIGTMSTLLMLVIGGYVTGRGLHTIAESLDNILGNRSHRHFFIDVLQGDEEILAESTVDTFYNRATEFVDSDELPEQRQEADETDLETLYLHVRSRVHMHGQGRSRTFQAVHAFYRSTHLMFIILVIVYFCFGTGVYFSMFQGVGNFTTYWGSLGLSGNTFVAMSELLAGITWTAFHDAKGDYRRYFIQYLIVDFIAIQESAE